MKLIKLETWAVDVMMHFADDVMLINETRVGVNGSVRLDTTTEYFITNGLSPVVLRKMAMIIYYRQLFI